jgi:cytochrome oxidase Cu insertion factor (SCO1/SenC/PrrC family)
LTAAVVASALAAGLAAAEPPPAAPGGPAKACCHPKPGAAETPLPAGMTELADGGAATPVRAALPPDTEVKLVDAALLDQDGTRVRFAQDVVGDHIVVVDFVFTTCTTICPVLSAKLARLQGRLGDRLGQEVRLISVSIDPVRDTPARLKAYGARFKARPGWIWVTGEKEEVDGVLKGLGAYTADFASHSPMMLVGDGRTGRFARFNGFPDTDVLLAAVDELSAARGASDRGGASDAP